MELQRSVLDALPIFPLPNVVLFPGALLPLHIFEPRYITLFGDVLSNQRVLGIVQLKPPFDATYFDRPATFTTCTVGYVVAEQQLPEGRYNVLVKGLARYLIEEELPPIKPYRLVRGRVLYDELPTEPTILTKLADELRDIAASLQWILREKSDALSTILAKSQKPSELADSLSDLLISDAATRQNILETGDLALRLRKVGDRLATLFPRPNQGSN